MKSLIVFHLLGVLVTVCQANEIANKEEYLKSINEERREYAKMARIPNMHKLIWDDHLEAKAKRHSTGCHFKTCREARLDKNKEYEKHAINMVKYYFGDDYRKQLIEDYTKFNMNGHEELTPGEKKIGCALRKYSDNNHNMTNYGLLEAEISCILEPEGTGKSWDLPRGDPGSKCDEGYENEDGLCAPVSKSEETEKNANQVEKVSPTTEASEESSTRGNCLFGVFLAIIVIYGML